VIFVVYNLEGRCSQRLEASETPLEAASDSLPAQSGQRRLFNRIEYLDVTLWREPFTAVQNER